MTIFAIALAGGFGAVARYGVSGAAQRRSRSGFPVGTLVVNLSGAFALGVLVGAGVEPAIPVGFLGGYTTFSTWMVESIAAPVPRMALNVGSTLAGGILAAYLGWLLGSVA